ncbi:RHTO0S02e04720g2_1 [Rhodotorula toruloides]|uniref:RHTO0S02e04720g2_1 n=1 Tax=Rhodotorula toruloides TaxID=5286 RepID=A0A061APH5_RHOTO|nr:RHTO0S02e04720g2_1 [Rhodotorula toruloides]
MPAPDYDYRQSSVDDDRRRAQEVWERVERGKRDTRPASQGEEAGANGADGSADGQHDSKQDSAARSIQSRYRHHVDQRTANGCNMSSSKRWKDGMKQRQMSEAGHDQDKGKNDAASRWRRGQVYASQITDGKSAAGAQGQEGELSAEEEMEALGRTDKEKKKIRKERVEAKQLEAQYWLELVDRKHRYASNLKFYHQKWNETDTDDNFFHWLDEGDGKDLDLEECPRKRLESECITYLTAEQREMYRVEVKDGLLVWAKDGQPLDTSKYHEDRGPDKGGIVAISEEEYEENRRKENEKMKKLAEAGQGDISSSDYDSSSSSSSSDEADEVREGVRAYGDKGGTAGHGKGVRQAKEALAFWDRWFCHSGKRRWLYVSDLQNNLYVGIKKTGSFQHSSFLYGARVTSAGLIKASKGHLTSLSPLSGHYRAGTMHFKSFVRSLEDQHVDMLKVSISKSVLTIRGIEKYGKFTKKKKNLKERFKASVLRKETESEKQKEEGQKEIDRIRNEEKGEGEQEHEKEMNDGREKASKERKKEDKPLPGEGKKVEEMTEEERTERGVALVQRAFERGLNLDSKGGTGQEDAESSSSSSSSSSNDEET